MDRRKIAIHMEQQVIPSISNCIYVHHFWLELAKPIPTLDDRRARNEEAARLDHENLYYLFFPEK